MEEILVSVIVPAYNSAHFIRQALDSALAQEVPMEILVIDDCSQDNLPEVIKENAYRLNSASHNILKKSVLLDE